jgi:gliding motility-associated-like protein
MTSGTGTASFAPNANDPNAVATVTIYGTKEFTWTEVNGTCSNESVVSVTFNQKPIALATANDKECGLTAELVVTSSVGIGLWKKTSGPGNAVFGTTADVTKRSVTVDQYGTYEFEWIETNTICTDSVKIMIIFYKDPVINSGTGGEVCGLSFNLQAVPSLGNGYWSASTTSSNVIFSPSANDPKARVTVNNYGSYDFIWTESNGSCSGSSSVTVTFWEQPSAYAGPDQILEYQFEATLDADIPLAGKGTWKVTDGKATIFNLNDPKSSVSGLAQGNNIFTWQVTNGICNVASDDIEITVNDIITPTVITPNDDGLNDELIFPGIDAFPGSSITIYNRWGSEVYRNADYKNDWKGKDQKRRDLEIDTYYYILKISNGRTIKGFVEIRR